MLLKKHQRKMKRKRSMFKANRKNKTKRTKQIKRINKTKTQTISKINKTKNKNQINNNRTNNNQKNNKKIKNKKKSQKLLSVQLMNKKEQNYVNKILKVAEEDDVSVELVEVLPEVKNDKGVAEIKNNKQIIVQNLYQKL